MRVVWKLGDRMAKWIAYFFIFALLGLVALWIFWHVLAYVYWAGWTLFWLGMLALVGWVVWSLFGPKLPKFQVKKKSQHKLIEHQKQHIYAFREEPSLKDVVLLTDELHVAKLELQGDILQLNSDTKIKIVEDSGKEAVKVEIKGTKSKEKYLWVPRSSIVETDGKKK
jgi:hypothetical protein